MIKRKATLTDQAGSTEAEYPKLRMIELALVDEPELPARESMDGDAMEDLKASMSAMGLISPIVVVEKGERFAVVAGHRRLLAARYLHWQTIRAFVYPAEWADQDAAMLHENIVREQLNTAQEAVFFAQLLERHKLDEEGLCRIVKRSPGYVAQRLALLRGDEKVFEALRAGLIPFAVARHLNRFPTQEWVRYYLDQAVRGGTSARVVESWYNQFMGNQQPEGPRVRETVQAAPAPEGAATVFECMLCGGSKDPWNLVQVMIHKWELVHLQRLMSEPVPVESSKQSEG